MSEMITITRKRYLELMTSEAKLILLENGGIDNWEWYGDSLRPEGEDNLETIETKLRKEIMGETE